MFVPLLVIDIRVYEEKLVKDVQKRYLSVLRVYFNSEHKNEIVILKRVNQESSSTSL